MAYTKQNFEDGQKLKAEHLNKIETGLTDIWSNMQGISNDHREDIAQLHEDVGTLDDKIAAIQSVSGGVTFTPSVDDEGNLSWTNNGGLDNPETVNIVGEVLDSVPRLTNVATTRETNSTTMTLNYNDGSTSTMLIQYEGGNPVRITVDGEVVDLEWISTNLDLFLNGDVCEAITGGWVATSNHTHTTNPYAPTLTIAGNTMTVSYNSSRNYAGGTVETVNEIDMSGYSKLIFNVTAVTNDSGQTSVERPEGGISLGVLVENAVHPYNFAALTAPVVGVNEIDISHLTGKGKVAINVISSSGLVSVSMDSIKVE